jgi:hypothetical protein
MIISTAARIAAPSVNRAIQLLPASETAGQAVSAARAFTRPYDPPHLHSFALLI